jgi:hypothetical protein
MLPGSDCGDNSICYLDQCISRNNIDLNIEYDINIRDLTEHCSSGGNLNTLKSSNHDPHDAVQCTNLENDFLCEQSQSCPKSNDLSISGLYIRHICCEKCSLEIHSIQSAFNQAKRINSFFITFFIYLIILYHN